MQIRIKQKQKNGVILSAGFNRHDRHDGRSHDPSKPMPRRRRSEGVSRRAKQGAGGRGRSAGDMEHHLGGLREGVRGEEVGGLRAGALVRAVRGEHRAGAGGVLGGGGGEDVGGREEVLRLQVEYLHRRAGVPSLYRGGVPPHHGDWVC